MDVAWHFGTPTCFYRDQMSAVYSHLIPQGFVPAETVARCQARFEGIECSLQQIFLDVATVASFFNQGLRIDPLVLQEFIVSVGYRLLKFQTISGPLRGSRQESVVHIALTALITTLFLPIGRRRLLQYRLVGQHLKDVVDAGLDEQDPEVVLWLLFLGGISVVSDRDEGWLFTNIQHSVRRAGVQDWPDLHRRLIRFPWIMSLHDAEAEQLWHSSLRMGHRSL